VIKLRELDTWRVKHARDLRDEPSHATNRRVSEKAHDLGQSGLSYGWMPDAADRTTRRDRGAP
jgi:hypothetical protein